MSNVLIGIIGVILFIGLALAGALFLGPRFQQATSNSDAAAVMTSIKQAIDAGEMWRVQEGKTYIPSTDTAFLRPGYLKSAPTNVAARGSSSPSAYYQSVHFDNNIHLYDHPEANYAAKFAIAVVGRQDDAKARDVCLAISRSYGTPTIPDFSTDSDPQPTAHSGCFLGYRLASVDAEASSEYVAYQRIAPASQSITQPSGF